MSQVTMQSSKPTSNDGVEFFNAQDGNGNFKSSLGYYQSVSHAPGVPPNSLIDVSQNGFIQWEGKTQNATFQDGDVFTWTLNATSQKQPNGDYCGVSSNNFRDFAVRKSDDLIKFKLNGWEYVSLYWCS